MSLPRMPMAGLITQTHEWVKVPTVTAWNCSLPRSGGWGCLPGFLVTQRAQAWTLGS